MAQEQEQLPTPELLFSSCAFAIVPSRDISDTLIEDLSSTLEENDGLVSELKADGTIRLDEVSHIISSTSDFPQYMTACDHMITVVTPLWVTTSLLKNKLAPPRAYSPDPRLFFSGVHITSADIPDGDADAIAGAVTAMGGLESNSLSRIVTHVVALTLDHPKCQSVLEKKLKCKIVLPHWFDDCLKLGRRIDERPYLLPDPEILRKREDEEVTIPPTTQIEGAYSIRPDYLPTPTDTPAGMRRLNVFNNKRVMLADDLVLGTRLRGIIKGLIEGGGGIITRDVKQADIYVCQYRDGNGYVTASRANKDVGNLSWLYHLITNNEWTSPFRRLLHYPIPKDGIPGFKNYRITLSNYGGEARIYLENLCVAAGAEFTKSMKQDNTHLITARKNSEKCNAAQEWNIHMVNHLWIEESYAKCQVQSISNPRYSHFPSRTNLGEVIGQTQFDRAALERTYFPASVTSSQPDLPSQPRTVMQTKDQNVAVLAAPRSSGELPQLPSDRQSSDGVEELPKKSVTNPTPIRKRRDVGTPVTDRISSGKENQTPSSTASRGAKDRALSKLHDLAPDVALYEKEKKRAGSGVWGGKRAADRIDKERKNKDNNKRWSSIDAEEEDTSEEEEEDRHFKKPKIARPSIEMKLVITGYTRWVDLPLKEDADRRKLRNMGINVQQNPLTCTHLAAPTIIRTKKFLCALATGVPILSTDFIDACLEQGEMPPVHKYLLKDTESEKKFKFKLKDVVQMAKFNGRRLLQNVPVYCTEQIINGPETFKTIVEANGGLFAVYRGRPGTVIKRKSPDAIEDEEPEPVFLLSGSTPEERRLWPKFEEMVRNGGMDPKIVQSEWLLDVALSQQMKWKDDYLVSTD